MTITFIILIAGPKTHGKNYLCDVIMNNNKNLHNMYELNNNNNKLEELYDLILKNNNYKSFAFANKLKHDFIEYMNENNSKGNNNNNNKLTFELLEKNKEIYRKDLQKFSQDFINKDEHYYTRHLYNEIMNKINENENENNNIFFITDFRKIREYTFLLDKFESDIISKKVIIQKWFVYDAKKEIDYNDEWENELHANNFDIIFKVK